MPARAFAAIARRTLGVTEPRCFPRRRPQREPAIAMQKKIDSRTPHTVGSATICLASHGYARFSLEVRKTSVRAFVNPTADDLKIGPRRDRQL